MATVDDIYQEAEKLKNEDKLEEAIEKLNGLLSRDESHCLSHLALAVLYGRVGKHEDAIRHGQRACELEPKDSFGFTAMSVTFQRAWQGTQNQEYIQLAENAMAQAQTLQGHG